MNFYKLKPSQNPHFSSSSSSPGLIISLKDESLEMAFTSNSSFHLYHVVGVGVIENKISTINDVDSFIIEPEEHFPKESWPISKINYPLSKLLKF